MKVIILGGNGFIGKNVTALFAHDTSYEVFSASRKNGLDLTDYQCTKKYFTGLNPDIIVNLAAHTGSIHYVTKYAADVIHDNILMPLNLYRVIAQACPQANVINVLSNCSYPGEAELQKEKEWLDGEVHDSILAYGSAKRALYAISRCYEKQYGVKTAHVLAPNVYGPGDHVDPNKTHALNGMIMRMIKIKRENKNEFEVWGTGMPMREWIYVADIANIIKSLCVRNMELSYPVNVAQKKGWSIKETAEIIADMLGYKGSILFNTSYADGAMKKILDNTEFTKHFPDFSFTDFREGIKNTIHYYESVI
ncbi:MAG: NAD-dependent epimerase/dehydratase family protein [Candidatus Sungbacteria bacterium]|nr:NAD-dependent epimerase/dehydratase family protein [bacterium]MDZ4260367.1 NAD-dependent epimerase/dehydratase family protein [Candidatus Sungbacteria bacterium]